MVDGDLLLDMVPCPREVYSILALHACMAQGVVPSPPWGWSLAGIYLDTSTEKDIRYKYAATQARSADSSCKIGYEVTRPLPPKPPCVLPACHTCCESR